MKTNELLLKIKSIFFVVKHTPMSLETYYKKIDESEEDLKQGKVKSFEEIKRRFSN